MVTEKPSSSARYHGFVTVQSRGVVAFPADLRRRFRLDEPGTQLELTERADGVIEVRPQIPVPVAQAWFWTDKWQAREAEVEDDLVAGRYTDHGDASDFVDALDT